MAITVNMNESLVYAQLSESNLDIKLFDNLLLSTKDLINYKELDKSEDNILLINVAAFHIWTPYVIAIEII